MERESLIVMMVERLQETLDAESPDNAHAAERESPLLGADAVISSLGLVSYVMDVEAMIVDECGAEVVLVNEAALSRRNSPFRSVETLADYVLELLGESVTEDSRVIA